MAGAHKAGFVFVGRFLERPHAADAPGAGGDRFDLEALERRGRAEFVVQFVGELEEALGRLGREDDDFAQQAVFYGVAAGAQFALGGFWAARLGAIFARGADTTFGRHGRLPSWPHLRAAGGPFLRASALTA